MMEKTDFCGKVCFVPYVLDYNWLPCLDTRFAGQDSFLRRVLVSEPIVIAASSQFDWL